MTDRYIKEPEIYMKRLFTRIAKYIIEDGMPFNEAMRKARIETTSEVVTDLKMHVAKGIIDYVFDE